MQSWWAAGGEEKKILRLFVQRVTYVCVGKKNLENEKRKKKLSFSPKTREHPELKERKERPVVCATCQVAVGLSDWRGGVVRVAPSGGCLGKRH